MDKKFSKVSTFTKDANNFMSIHTWFMKIYILADSDSLNNFT